MYYISTRPVRSLSASLNFGGRKALSPLWLCGRTGGQRRGVEAKAFDTKNDRMSLIISRGGAFALAVTLVLYPCPAGLATGDPESFIPALTIPSSTIIAPALGVTPILPEDTDQATLDDLLVQAMSYLRGALLGFEQQTLLLLGSVLLTVQIA
jgi:hypothetical protein